MLWDRILCPQSSRYPHNVDILNTDVPTSMVLYKLRPDPTKWSNTSNQFVGCD